MDFAGKLLAIAVLAEKKSGGFESDDERQSVEQAVSTIQLGAANRRITRKNRT
jgi:hypothetical protein